MPFALIFVFMTAAFAGEIRDSAARMAELEAVVRSLNEKECSETNEGFPRISSGLVVACASFAEHGGYEETTIVDCTGTNGLYPGGYRFRSRAGHPEINMNSPYGPNSKPERLINFWSRNHALNETFIYINDQAGGPDSHDMKSSIILLPRKVVPSVVMNGNDVEVTMTTGEKVIFDKRTSAIKSGALREGPNDLTTDRFRRQPPNVHYQGTGISIRLNHRFEDPFQSAESAEVKQNGRSCRVPRTTLFDSAGKLKTESDAQLVRVLNQSCPSSPGTTSFRI